MAFRILSACLLAVAMPSISAAEEPAKAEASSRAPTHGGLATTSARAKDLQVSGAKEQSIRKLIRVTNGLQLGIQALDQLFAQLRPSVPQVSDEAWSNLVAEVRGAAMSDFEALLVPVYDRHFTQEEVDGLVAFYESPLGKKTVEKMPAVMGEAMAVGGAWGQAVMERIVERAQTAKGATYHY